MKRTVALVYPVVAFCCISCGGDADRLRIETEKQVNKLEHQAKEQVQAISQNAELIKSEIKRLTAAVDKKDVEKLKDACEAVDLRLGTRVVGKYHRAFALEIEEGPSEVIEYLDAEIENLADGDAERSALEGLREYFKTKGTLTTKDAAFLILVVALETKFPHGRGTIFLVPFLDSEDAEKK